jgi:hypothetical protein
VTLVLCSLCMARRTDTGSEKQSVNFNRKCVCLSHITDKEIRVARPCLTQTICSKKKQNMYVTTMTFSLLFCTTCRHSQIIKKNKRTLPPFSKLLDSLGNDFVCISNRRSFLHIMDVGSFVSFTFISRCDNSIFGLLWFQETPFSSSASNSDVIYFVLVESFTKF